MSPAGRPGTARWWRRVAEGLQEALVLPHCPRCTRPCCLLDQVVIELTWEQVRALWGVEGDREAFDRALALGEGPAELRAADGLYYAHTRPCPAFEQGRCRVYGTPLKPRGCTEFPVYPDRGGLLVDLRCEALALDRVLEQVRAAAGRRARVRWEADPRFPYLVTVRVRLPRRRAGARSLPAR